tara:strand:- start:971 stop:1498 length:528 start_codon:yes stop_codon:yes gene_type:complete
MRKERQLMTGAHSCAHVGLKHEEGAIAAVEQALSEAERLRMPISVILCDVDHLEVINAIHGRAAGDSLLLQLFIRVCEFIPVEDVIWESERADLLIIARNHSYIDAYNLAETVRESVASELFHVAQQPIMVTVSLGSRSIIPDPDTKADDILGLVEEQLELSKQRGPNAVVPTVN